jgi:hypothetical protein
MDRELKQEMGSEERLAARRTAQFERKRAS